MDILTADGQFDYAVWYVLNHIQKQKLPYPNKGVYYYIINIDIRNRANFLYGIEYDAIQFLMAEKVIKEIGEPDDIRGGVEGTPSFQCEEGHHFKALARFDEFYKLYTNKIGKLVKRGEWEENNNDFCRFENNTLFVTLSDGSEKSIVFDTREETKYMLILFQILYRHWQVNGSDHLPKVEIMVRMRKAGVQEDRETFLKDTVGNIRGSKINPVGLSKYVVIHYDRKVKGYALIINPPQFLADTPQIP